MQLKLILDLRFPRIDSSRKIEKNYDTYMLLFYESILEGPDLNEVDQVKIVPGSILFFKNKSFY